MAICSVCKIEILEGEEALSMGSHVVHQQIVLKRLVWEKM